MGFWDEFAKNPPSLVAQAAQTTVSYRSQPASSAPPVLELQQGAPPSVPSRPRASKTASQGVRPRIRGKKRPATQASRPSPQLSRKVENLCRSALLMVKERTGGVKDTFMLELTPECAKESILPSSDLEAANTGASKAERPRKSARKQKKSAAWIEQQRAQFAVKELWAQKQKKNPCKFFLSGKCQKGKLCQFRHEGLQTPLCEAVLRSLRGNGQTPPRSCNIAGCPYIHDLKHFPCMFFHSRNQICTRSATSCQFSHLRSLSVTDERNLKYIKAVLGSENTVEKMKKHRRVGNGGSRQNPALSTNRPTSSILAKLAP